MRRFDHRARCAAAHINRSLAAIESANRMLIGLPSGGTPPPIGGTLNYQRIYTIDQFDLKEDGYYHLRRGSAPQNGLSFYSIHNAYTNALGWVAPDDWDVNYGLLPYSTISGKDFLLAQSADNTTHYDIYPYTPWGTPYDFAALIGTPGEGGYNHYVFTDPDFMDVPAYYQMLNAIGGFSDGSYIALRNMGAGITAPAPLRDAPPGTVVNEAWVEMTAYDMTRSKTVYTMSGKLDNPPLGVPSYDTSDTGYGSILMAERLEGNGYTWSAVGGFASTATLAHGVRKCIRIDSGGVGLLNSLISIKSDKRYTGNYAIVPGPNTTYSPQSDLRGALRSLAKSCPWTYSYDPEYEGDGIYFGVDPGGLEGPYIPYREAEEVKWTSVVVGNGWMDFTLPSGENNQTVINWHYPAMA